MRHAQSAGATKAEEQGRSRLAGLEVAARCSSVASRRRSGLGHGGAEAKSQWRGGDRGTWIKPALRDPAVSAHAGVGWKRETAGAGLRGEERGLVLARQQEADDRRGPDLAGEQEAGGGSGGAQARGGGQWGPRAGGGHAMRRCGSHAP
jgi:hypothetical protein